MMRVRSLLLLTSLSSACWQRVEHVNEGEVCFRQGSDFVQVQVSIDECLSPLCSRNVEGVCNATVDGNEITLESRISWEQEVREGACPGDCRLMPVAQCATGSLPDGTYTVRFGDETLELTVPVESDCLMYATP